MPQNEKVLVVDFGGQYNQLVARRVRECNVYCEIVSYRVGLDAIRAQNPKGIIFTGGPNSVYVDGAPTGCTRRGWSALLDEYLPQADCVAITLPGTTATKGMFDAERMAKMKDGAILLNVGRGMIVDTDALCAALENGKLAGAGVDVTDPEPLPADHPLWKMENAVITPHISGGYHLQETHDRIVRIMAENLKRFLAGEPLRNVVDFSTGYRKL